MQPAHPHLRQQRINFAAPARRQDQNHTLPKNSWGDFLGPKSPLCLWCYLQNPNRNSARDDFVDFRYLCQMLMTHDVDIFGLPESGLDWKQHTPQNKCRQIMDDFWDHTRLVTLTSNVTCDSFTQFGSTCPGITGKWSGRILEQGMDSHGLGRWSYVRLHGKNGREIIIVRVYQACQALSGPSGQKLPTMHNNGTC